MCKLIMCKKLREEYSCLTYSSSSKQCTVRIKRLIMPNIATNKVFSKTLYKPMAAAE